MINRILTKLVDATPYKMWYNKKLVLSHVKVWNYPIYMKKTTLDELESKFDKRIFVGYPKESLGYYFYNPLE